MKRCCRCSGNVPSGRLSWPRWENSCRVVLHGKKSLPRLLALLLKSFPIEGEQLPCSMRRAALLRSLAGGTNTYLCIPILAQGEAIGILHVQATDEDPSLGEVDLSFKTTFASQVGLSVANIRLRDTLKAQSIKDPLTGL